MGEVCGICLHHKATRSASVVYKHHKMDIISSINICGPHMYTRNFNNSYTDFPGEWIMSYGGGQLIQVEGYFPKMFRFVKEIFLYR